MGQLTISMAMFNSYVSLPEGNQCRVFFYVSSSFFFVFFFASSRFFVVFFVYSRFYIGFQRFSGLEFKPTYRF